MVALQISPKIESCMDWVDWPKNYKGLYGILQQKTLKLGRVAFHSSTFQF